MNEFRERAFVEGRLDRKNVFPEVRWLSKARFQEAVRKGISIQPYLGDKDSASENRVYLGKSIPKRPPDIDENNNTLGSFFISACRLQK